MRTVFDDAMYLIVPDQTFRQMRRARPGRALAWISLGIALGLTGAAHAPRLSPLPSAEASVPMAAPAVTRTAWCDTGTGSLQLACALN